MSQGEALDVVPKNWTNLSIDDKLNSMNAQLIVLNRMVEDIVTQFYNAQQKAPDQTKILEKYRSHVSKMMKERGMDEGAISFFNEFLSINFND